MLCGKTFLDFRILGCGPFLKYTTCILGTCERAAENSAFGSCFRHPFHRTPTRASARFNLFKALARRAPRESLHRRTRFRHPLSLTLPISPLPQRGPILAPRALSPKWTSLRLPCASWLAVYTGLCCQLAFALASLSIVAL